MSWLDYTLCDEKLRSKMLNITSRRVAEHVLSADNWVSDIYDLSDIYSEDDYDIQISIHPAATDEQKQAWSNANPIGNTTANRIIALNGAPNIDISIIITSYTK